MMASLIQRRFAIVRVRNEAIGLLVFGTIFLALSIGGLLFGSEPDGFDWARLGLAVIAIGYGTLRLRRYRANLATFETEHGAGAGNQN